VCQLQPSLAIEPALLTNLVCKIRLRHTSGRKLGSMLQIDNMERLSHHRHCHDSIARCMLLRDWMKMLEVAQPGWLSPACLASRALLGPLSAIQGSWTNPRATSYLQPYSHAFPCRTLGCKLQCMLVCMAAHDAAVQDSPPAPHLFPPRHHTKQLQPRYSHNSRQNLRRLYRPSLIRCMYY